ncbi:inner membrane protein YhjD [Rhodococcus sp. NPDC058521]|uniref:inner membrane protein YhjD n=1 Tax=Rhodococcus sp. NPDC058521 TaxID=3346536 RepID=UPI00365258FD
MAEGPSFLERQRAARPWLDHLVRAAKRYQEQKGDYYAAGITYFSVLALVPIIMVAFAIAGFVLAGHPEWLTQIQDSVTEAAPGSLGETLNQTIDSAIASRAGVGIIGLLGAAYAGLGWMANLRDALTAMWESQRESDGFVKTKISDGINLLGLGLAIVVSIGASALSSGPITKWVVDLLHLDAIPGIGIGLRILSTVLAVAATWAIFTWIISRLPREPVAFRSAIKAGLLGAVVFEIFKQVAAIYLASVTSGPAGAAFGPIIGLLVFVFMTCRMILFATAWAATTEESMAMAFVPPPDPAIISPRMHVSGRPSARSGAALVGVGIVAALGLSGLFGRKKSRS